jgi:magnesium transporter
MPVQILVLEPDGSFQTEVPLGELGPTLAREDARIWVDLLDPELADYEVLQRVFSFHPLAIEDCHNNIQRPKVDDYGNHIFTVFHGLNLNEGADPLDMLELDSFLGANYLVTVRYGRLFSIRDVWDRVVKNPDLLKKGPDYVYYLVVDRMVDYYFELMERIDDELDSLEDRLFTDIGRDVLQQILNLKRRIMALRRVAGPQREVMNQLSRGDFAVTQGSTRYYFRDVYDHLLRIGDALDSYRDTAGSAMETYMTQLSNRANDIMKVLSIIATIMLPLSLITGYFGMNFHQMPWLGNRYAVYWLTGGMVVLALGMLAYFRHKRWF